MALKSNMRNYRMTDSELCLFSSVLCDTMHRDISLLSAFGVKPNDINLLENLVDEFKNFPNDDFIQCNVMSANEDLKALRELILKTFHSMAMRVKIKWSADSVQFKSLEFGKPSLLSDDLLMIKSGDFLIKITGMLTELGSTGLTQEMLNDWSDLNVRFEENRQKKAKSEAVRIEKTSERIAKGNEIYGLVTRYCNIGKQIFENVNPAKYNNYLIYKDYGWKKMKKKKNDLEVATIEEA